MKAIRLFLTICSAALFAIVAAPSHAQLQQGNTLIGASSNLAGLSFGFGSTSDFRFGLAPKIGYFIENNIAIGALIDMDYQKVKGIDGVFNYKLNAFSRYYIPKGEIYNPLQDARFFLEAQAGIGGKPGIGLGLNVAAGVGIAYFITSNIAFESSVMFHSIFGSGNNTGLGINFGFSMHLPTGQLRDELRRVESQLLAPEGFQLEEQ